MKSQTLVLTMLLAANLAAPASAAQITVTSSGDGDAASLRAAIASAADGDTIVLQVPAPTITLSLGSIEIGKNVTIVGPGAAQLTIQRDAEAPPSGLFVIDDGTTVAISGVTLSGGMGDYDPWYYAVGGAINNMGQLTLSKTVLTGNRAGWGGAVANNGEATLTIVDSLLTNNIGGGYLPAGAAIYTFSGQSSVTVVRSTIASNTVIDAGGTAIAAYSGARVRIVDSTIEGTMVAAEGGTQWTFDESTLVGVWDAAPLLDEAWGPSSVTAKNSIFVAQGGWATLKLSTVTSLGYNLFSDGIGTQPTDRSSADPLLDVLQMNGGLVPTYALLPGSPAIDAGSCSDSTGVTIVTDERGVARPSGSSCDIGAFEVEQNTTATMVQAVQQLVTKQLDTLNSVGDTVNAIKATTTDVDGWMTKLDADVLSRSSQQSVDKLSGAGGSTALETKIDQKASQTSVDALTQYALERALADGVRVVTYMLPASAGGKLDAVTDLVDRGIHGMALMGVDVTAARRDFARGQQAVSRGDFRSAYDWFVSAYQRLVTRGDR